MNEQDRPVSQRIVEATAIMANITERKRCPHRPDGACGSCLPRIVGAVTLLASSPPVKSVEAQAIVRRAAAFVRGFYSSPADGVNTAAAAPWRALQNAAKAIEENEATLILSAVMRSAPAPPDEPPQNEAERREALSVRSHELQQAAGNGRPIPRRRPAPDEPPCRACVDGECPTHLGTPSHLGAPPDEPPPSRVPCNHGLEAWCADCAAPPAGVRNEDFWMDELEYQLGRPLMPTGRDHLRSWLRAFAANVKRQALASPPPDEPPLLDCVEAEIQKPGYAILRGWLAIHGGESARIVLEEVTQLVRTLRVAPPDEPEAHPRGDKKS